MKNTNVPEWIIEALENMKAHDIQPLSVAHLTSVTDFMVICSGTSNTQIRAIANHLIEDAKKRQLRPLGIEGLENAEWVLVDLGDTVVHIMHPEARATYDLEKLWDFTEDYRQSDED